MKPFLIIILLFITGSSFSQNVVQAEYFVDSDNGFGKNTLVSVTAAPDGSFPFKVNLSSVAPGYHKLYIRTKDSDGKWSITTRRNIEVLANAGKITTGRGEYFFDSDPGFGAANTINVSSPDSVIMQNFTAATNTLSIGYHKLYIRMKDNEGRWGITARRNVEIVPSYSKRTVQAGEYFFDSDPGFGSGNAITVTPKDSIIFQNFTTTTAGLSTGYHKLYIRLRDSENKWGLTLRRNSEIYKSVTSVINGAEYFFKTDSGFGKAVPVKFTNPAADGSFTFKIPLDKIAAGTNTIYIRAKDSVNNNWSITQWIKDTLVTSTGADTVWSHPATWSSGKVPDANTVVMLYHKVYVDIVTATCKSFAPYRNDAQCIVMPNMKLTVTGKR